MILTAHDEMPDDVVEAIRVWLAEVAPLRNAWSIELTSEGSCTVAVLAGAPRRPEVYWSGPGPHDEKRVLHRLLYLDTVPPACTLPYFHPEHP